MIAGTIDESDFLAAQHLHRRPSLRLRRMYIVLAVLGVSAGVVALWLNHYVVGGALIGAVVGGIIGEALVRFLYLPWRARRIYRQQKSLHDSFGYSWDREALLSESTVGTARRPWAQFTKWKESNDIFLLYHSDVVFEMLPKRWFKEPSQLREFREHLRAYVVT